MAAKWESGGERPDRDERGHRGFCGSSLTSALGQDVKRRLRHEEKGDVMKIKLLIAVLVAVVVSFVAVAELLLRFWG